MSRKTTIELCFGILLNALYFLLLCIGVFGGFLWIAMMVGGYISLCERLL